MGWKFAADAVAIVHALWVGAVLIGPLWAWRNRTWRKIHLVLLILTGVWVFYCPLTVFENALRYQYDPSSGLQTGFLARHLAWCVDLRPYGPALDWAMRGWAGLWIIIYGILWARELTKKT